MTKGEVTPVFVSRQTAARMLEISVDTFDQWVRTGFVPPPHVDRGQVTRWHWPSIEQSLAEPKASSHHDPFIAGLANVKKGRNRAAA